MIQGSGIEEVESRKRRGGRGDAGDLSVSVTLSISEAEARTLALQLASLLRTELEESRGEAPSGAAE